MRRLLLFGIVILFPFLGLSQEKGTAGDLIREAETKMYSHPEQAGKIASYLISQKNSNSINAHAHLLLAKSFYVRGYYNETVKNAVHAKKIAFQSENMKIQETSTIFALKLFRELGLDPVANKYRQDLKNLMKRSIDTNKVLLMEATLKEDSAKKLFQNLEYAMAEELQEEALSLFSKSKDTLAITAGHIAFAEILMEHGMVEKAVDHLEEIKELPLTDFEKLQILDLMGRFYFNRKEYTNAASSYKEALKISQQLPNQIYESKSLEGLTLVYLALEDTNQFFQYRQRNNLLSTEIEVDKSQAINSVYNFINTFQKEQTEEKKGDLYFIIYILLALLIIIIGIGLAVNYLYTSKTKEYLAIYKYVAPKKAIVTQSKTEIAIKNNLVPEETEEMILEKLDKFEKGKKYTNPDMSIAFLASQFDTNTKYLSEVINRQKGKNFNSYVNELRINYIINKLKTDSAYFNYKISYLAEESGFSSHSSFTTVFKSVTGIAPTKFMAFLKERKETA